MTEITNSERVIGRLETGVELLTKTVEAGQREGREGRARIYGELELIRDDAAASRMKLDQLEQRIRTVEPVISEINNWRQRGIGVLMFLAMMASMFGALITILWKKITIWLGWS